MKQKHLSLLNKFQKYGEDYDYNIPYNKKCFKYVSFGREETTRPFFRESKADIFHDHKNFLRLPSSASSRLIIIGDSIAKGLCRNKCFNDRTPLITLNFGIGGDKTLNILWRVQNYDFSPVSFSPDANATYFFIQCGTNNLFQNSINEIANGILSIGVMAQFKNPSFKIVIGGLLPCIINDMNMVPKVQAVNGILERKCRKLKFCFMKQDCTWYDIDGLNNALHSIDKIHLSNIGNIKLANTIVTKLQSLCSSSDPIMKIPSFNEVNYNDNGSNIDVPSVSMSHSFVPVVSRYVKTTVKKPSFIPAPECDYDHSKALQQVLLKESHYSVSISSRSESRKKCRGKKQGSSVGGHSCQSHVSSLSSSQTPSSTVSECHHTTNQPLSHLVLCFVLHP